MNKNVQTFLACTAEYAAADIVLGGVPFDGTTSFRPGARFGPAAIRNESFGLETYSPYCDRDLTEISVFDAGDLDLPFGNAAKVIAVTEDFAARIYNDDKIPVLLGGEHLITLGAVRAALNKYPDLNIIQFDAHTDLREEYLGETLTHAGIIKQIWNLTGDGKIFQFGIRSGEKQEFSFAAQHTALYKFNLNEFFHTAELLKDKPVYFTLDLDVLDPSIFCGTGTPEAGGVSFQEVLDAVLKLNELNVVGCDICELAPHYDQSGVSTAVACKITREILLQLKKRRGDGKNG